MHKRKFLWIKIKAKFVRKRRINISWIIFGITILLLLSIILPVSFQRAPYYSLLVENLDLPYQLKLYGNLYMDEEAEDYSAYKIYVGGYGQNIKKDGSFEISFLSQTKDDIVIVIMDKRNIIAFCSKISFGDKEIKNFDIRIRGYGNEV